MILSMKHMSNDPIKFIANIISSMPLILLRSGSSWLSFKKQAQKGGKTFQKELICQGLDKETARLFTREYVGGSNLLKLFFNQS